MSRIITFTTDFSSADPYIGVLKGVVMSSVPELHVVDIAHGVYPQDVFQASFVIKCAYHHYPEGTIHLAAVDPGVGSARKAIAMKCGGYYFVGPDNGIFSYPIKELGVEECVELTVTRPDRLHGCTFDARDVFAPTAARIANGDPLSSLGKPVDSPTLLDVPEPRLAEAEGIIRGQVIYIDHFGNSITNITAAHLEHLGGKPVVYAMGLSLGEIKTSYAQAGLREILAVIDSLDYLEIAVNHGNASESLNLSVGSRIEVRREE